MYSFGSRVISRCWEWSSQESRRSPESLPRHKLFDTFHVEMKSGSFSAAASVDDVDSETSVVDRIPRRICPSWWRHFLPKVHLLNGMAKRSDYAIFFKKERPIIVGMCEMLRQSVSLFEIGWDVIEKSWLNMTPKSTFYMIFRQARSSW